MKQLIVLCACLPLALMLILQISITTTNNNNAYFVQDVVEQAANEASYDGCFTDENIEEMKNKIATRLGISPDEIVVIATGESDVKYKNTHYLVGDRITYRVEVPIEKVIAGGSFFGISEDENKGVIIKEGYVLSERLRE